MKHFNLKTLTIGAALAGSLVAGNVCAQEEDANLDLGDVKIVTLQLGTGNCIGINNSETKKWEGKTYFGTPNGSNGRVGFIKANNDQTQYYIASQGVLLKIDENGKSTNAKSYDDATLFNLKGTTASFYLQTSDGTRYLSGATDNGLTTSTSKPGTAFNITQKTTDITASDGVQTIGSYKFYSIAVPYKVKKPASDDTNKYYTFVFSKEGNEIKATDEDVVPAGVPFLYVTNAETFTLTIPTEDQDYKLEVSKGNNVLDGFFYAIGSGSNLHTTALTLGIKDKKLGYFAGMGFGDKNNTPANRGYFEAETAEELGAAAFELDFDEETGALTVKIISAETGLINECVALAKELQTLYNNTGAETGKYNVGENTLETAEKSIWINLSDYINAENGVYNKSKADLETLKTTLVTILHKVKETNVHGLANVEIVTLQWNNTGNYSGLNSGSKWETPTTFGTPNGGNGRIGLVKQDKTTNRYYIACQGLFLKLDEGVRKTANGCDDATAFITMRSSENGLTFVTEDWKYYLTQADFTSSSTAPTEDYKINTFDNNQGGLATNIQVVEDKVTLKIGETTYYYNSLVYPYKVQKPEGDNYQAFILSKNEDGSITAEKKETIDAGVPFIYITTSNGDDARMTIPQESQEYSENVKDNVLKGFYMPLNADSKEHTEAYSLSTKDGKVGYFLGGNFGGDLTAANRGYIDAETADELNAESFELVYDNTNGTLTVNIVKPTVSVTITDAGWATLYSDKALDFSAVDGLTAYTATVDKDQTTVTLTEVSDVPANAGVVLKGDAKEYKIPVTTESTNEDKGSLTGSVDKVLNYDDTSAEKDYYILAKNSAGNVQFTKLGSGSVDAGKAYLELDKKTDNAARVLSVVFEGETTGIVDTNREATADGRIYNLNGQSVAQPAKGLYIVNGKKVVIK